MARPAKKQPPQKFEEPDEAEGWEDAVVDADDKDGANLRLRDWRDVERFREMKELRRLVDDDYGLEEIFHIPLKPRAEPAIPGVRTSAKGPAAPAKPGAKGAPPPAVKPAGKGQPPAKAAPAAKAPAHAPAPAHHKPAAKKPAPPKVKAKAKRK